MANNLYENKVYFKLIIDSKSFYINEPVNWKDLAISNIRDPDFFGVIYEFIDANFSIGFASDDISYQLILSVLAHKGQDGPVIFEFGILVNEVESKIFSGNVNLNTYSDKNNVLTAAIENVDFDSLYRTRFETNITLSSNLNLDNTAIAPLVPKSVKLHSKKISKLFKAQITDPISDAVDDGSLSRILFVDIDTSNEIASELLQNQGIPMGISGGSAQDNDRFWFSVEESGTYQLNVIANFKLTAFRSFGVGDFDYVPKFLIRRAGTIILDRSGSYAEGRLSGTNAPPYLTLNVNINFQWNGELQIGDELFLTYEGSAEHAGGTYKYWVDNYTSTVTLLGQTTAAATQCNMYTLFDAITQMLESATGRQDALKSSFLGSTGCGALYCITNGYQVRNFDIGNKPVIDNLKRAITAISYIEGLGVGITTIAGLDYLVIEPLSYFFRNKEIIKIVSLNIPSINSRDEFEYSEENAKEFIYNEYEIGYSKYSTEELNTLDEFNTYQEGLFPIKTYKAKFSKKVDYITSGYSIEVQRREQFKANPSESLTDDDNIFLVSCIAGPSGLEAERDQNFTNIENLYSPETAYNLRLRPKRMLYNWAPYLNIGLWAKGGDDVIKNTFTKNNGLIKAQMIGGCLRYGPPGIAQENGDISIVEYQAAGPRFHLPINCIFKSPLRFDDAMILKKAMIGEDNVDNSYGYIIHPDDKGNLWKSYVYSFKFTPSTEVAEFKVAKIEKYSSNIVTEPFITIVNETSFNLKQWSNHWPDNPTGDPSLADVAVFYSGDTIYSYLNPTTYHQDSTYTYVSGADDRMVDVFLDGLMINSAVEIHNLIPFLTIAGPSIGPKQWTIREHV